MLALLIGLGVLFVAFCIAKLINKYEWMLIYFLGIALCFVLGTAAYCIGRLVLEVIKL